jgi:hypothetical protein
MYTHGLNFVLVGSLHSSAVLTTALPLGNRRGVTPLDRTF